MRELMRNKKAGLEGLPLYLLIMVIIAAVGIAVVLSWMGTISDPQAVGEIELIPDEIYLDNEGDGTHFGNVSINITVKVKDSSGAYLAGADVILIGGDLKQPSGGITIVATTDANGVATFSNLYINSTFISNPSTYTPGHITVKVTKTDYVEKVLTSGISIYLR